MSRRGIAVSLLLAHTLAAIIPARAPADSSLTWGKALSTPAPPVGAPSGDPGRGFPWDNQYDRLRTTFERGGISAAQAHRHRPLSETERSRHRTKSKVRAKVEYACLVIKRIFGWAKVRHRGLAKNTHWLDLSCGLANLSMARRRLLVGT